MLAMPLREILWGNQREIQADQRYGQLRRISKRRKLNAAQQKELDETRGPSRRLFLRRVTTVVGTSAALTTPIGAYLLEKFLKSPEPQYAAPELQTLAQEARAWTLVDGRKMTTLFPETEIVAAVLSGKVDPRTFMPFIQPRILFANDTDDAMLQTRYETDDAAKTKAVITLPKGGQFPGGANLNYAWLGKNRSFSTIKISPEIQRSTIRVPVALKEASQLKDMPEYYQLYLQVAQDQGVEFTVVNPDNLPISEAEKIANIAENLGFAEKALTGESTSFLDTIADIGSHIRMGGITFANWYQDQLNRGYNPVETAAIKAGKNFVGLLESKGVLRRQGDIWAWTNGSAPEISSPRFLQLVLEMSTKSIPSFR